MNELLALMDKVKTSGTFSVGGTLPSIPPGLKVKGVGSVALPLLEQQAKSLIELGQPDFLTSAYGPALVTSLKALDGRDYDQAITKKFSEDVRQKITATFPAPPEAPRDWSREGQLACKCEFCTEINRFLPDPTRRDIHFYKTLKRNLLHIESMIAQSQVELNIDIRRTPPKFDGTCKKNQSRYDNKRKLFDTAQQIVQDLGAYASTSTKHDHRG